MAVQKADYIWRDWEVDGVSASNPHKAIPREIRQWGTWVEDNVKGEALTALVEVVQASLSELKSRFDVLPINAGAARFYETAAGTYILDSGDTFPNFHYFDINGATVADVSGCQTYETYIVVAGDYASGSLVLDAGTGNTWIGSADRDGFTASQAILLRGGEAAIFTRLTGSKFALIGGIGNPDILRIVGGTVIRMWEQPSGRYTVHFQRNAAASSATDFDVVVSGKTIDFTNAAVIGAPVIIEDNSTSRSHCKVRSLGNNGATGGRVVIENPNAAILTVAVTLMDVEVS